MGELTPSLVPTLMSVACLVGLAACQRSGEPAQGQPPSAAAPAEQVAAEPVSADSSVAPFDREWTLVELRGQPAPTGAGGRPATLLLAADRRASGFAGCNRLAGSYRLDADTLRFGPIITTKMACDVGLELEREYTTALEAARGYRATAKGLELTDGSVVLARFEAR